MPGHSSSCTVSPQSLHWSGTSGACPPAMLCARGVCANVQVAETLLRRGFSSPGSGPIDIFGVAAALAEGNASLSCPCELTVAAGMCVWLPVPCIKTCREHASEACFCVSLGLWQC